MTVGSDSPHFAALIIGGGPAGLSCALELADSNVSHILIERAPRLGGQVNDIPSPIVNFAGGAYANGEALARQMSAAAAPANIRTGLAVDRVDLRARTATAGGQVFSARALLIATGYRVARLGIEGEADFAGDISYRPGTEASLCAGQTVAIVGGGDSALFSALELAALCPQVHIINRSERLRARLDLKDRLAGLANVTVHMASQVTALAGTGRLERVHVLKAGRSEIIPAERLIVKIGYSPNTELFAGQVDMDASGHIVTADDMSTSVPGVFAAGDITAACYQRLATAIGQGMIAAGAIRRFIGQV